MLVLFLYKLLVLLGGAGVGALIVGGLFVLVAHEPPEPLVVVIGGIVGGVVTLWLWKFCIIIVSSATGAVAFCLGTNTLQTVWFPLGLTLAGIAVQYGALRYFGSQEEGDGTGCKTPRLFQRSASPVRAPETHTTSVPKVPKKEICPFCLEPSFKASARCEACGQMKR